MDGEPRTRWRLSLVLLLGLFLAGSVHSYLERVVVAPGSTFVTSEGDGKLLATSVAIRRAYPWELLRAEFDSAVTAVAKPEAVDVDLSGHAAAMEGSRASAMAAARRFVGRGSDGAVPSIETYGIVGPSAGLMMALGWVDTWTGHDLSRGRVIAGTGTISAEGAVGPVWGIPFKVVAAERAGAIVFLVPYQQLDEAREAATRCEVVGVRSLEEAVTALRS